MISLKSFKNILKNPVLSVAIVIVGIACISSIENHVTEKRYTEKKTALMSETVQIPSVTIPYSSQDTDVSLLTEPTETVVSSTVTETTAVTTTTAVTEVAETTTVTTHEVVYDHDYISAGYSPNSQYYQDRLVILGDSIASGFNIYGYIPTSHNIAVESFSLTNEEMFEFDVGAGEMSMSETIEYVKPVLIYMSVGLNDIPMTDKLGFAELYRQKIELILEKVPDAVIVVSGICPVSQFCEFTHNYTINEYNLMLERMVNNMVRDNVYYFNAYSVLSVSDDCYLSDYYSGGDGIHLNSYAYSDLLAYLFHFLDYTDAFRQIEKAETYRQQ